jgi:PAS domain S-box-containing protein
MATKRKSKKEITERKKAEEETARHLRNLQFISTSAMHLMQPMSYDEIFEYTGKQLHSLLDNEIVIVNEYDAERNCTIVRAVHGRVSDIDKLSMIMGRDPVGIALPFDLNTRQRMVQGELVHVEGGLYDLAFNQIPLPLCQRMEQEVNIGNIYAIPFSLDEDFLGTVAIVSHGRALPRNADVIKTFVNQAAIALNRKRSEEALKEAARLSDALNNIDAVINSTLDFNEIMKSVVQKGCEALGAETAAISVRRDDQWVVGHVHGFPAEIIGTTMVDEEEPHAVLSIKTKQPVIINDAFNDERVNREHMQKYNVRSVMVIPLTIKEKVIGVLFLNYHSAPVTFTNVQIDFARKIGYSLGLALENARLFDELWRSRNRLEIRVQERTAELMETVEELQDETSERKRAEEALIEQSTILEGFFTSTITPLVFLDRDFNFIRVNEAYAKACQRDISEFPGHNHFEFYPSDAKKIFERVVATKIPYQAVARSFSFPDHPERGLTYWDWTLIPLLNKEGEVEFLVFSLQDVTEREKAAEKIREQAAILDLAHDAIIVRSMDGTILFWNHGAEVMYGWAKQEAGGKVTHKLLQTQFPELLDGINMDLIRNGYWEGELTHTRQDGKRITVESRWAIQRDKEDIPRGILEINRDITDRKRAEEAVKAERQRFNDVLEMVPAYLVLLTPDHHVAFANRVFRERFGEDRGRRCFEFLFGRSEPCEICETYSVLKTMAPHHWEWTGPDGRNYDIFDFPFTDTDGSALILEMGVDITQRKRAEDALKATSLYARSLIEASLDPLVTISRDGKVMDVNRATEHVTGVAREQLIGSDFLDYFTEPEKAREGYQKVFSKETVRDYPLAILHTSGKNTDVLYNATVFRNEAGEIQGVFATARDVTELKAVQKRIEATNMLLGLFVKKLTRKEYLDSVIELVQHRSDCRCVGIRVLDEKNYIPYQSYLGFSQEFWESENCLSVEYDQCACIRVVTGNPDSQDRPVMTPAGSFRCENTFEFLDNLSEDERARFRGVCIQNGFKSVAIIPIRYREKILGAIHLADEGEGKVPISNVEFIEFMAPLIGEAINRFNLEEELKDSENRLRHLSSQLLTVQENERKRISREIHDSLGQSLSAIKFKVEGITQQMHQSRRKKIAESLGTILPIIQISIEESRRIQMDLRPSVLDDLGIIATLNWFSREFRQTYSAIRIEKETDIEENEVPDTLKTVIYRISQEALNNIAKHSKADLVRLFLKKKEDKIELIIEDNGKGFDLDKILSLERSKRGLGLTSMQERAELSGGTFEMESILGKGTTIKATWPI